MFIQIKVFFIISIVVTGITANFLDDIVEFAGIVFLLIWE